jgi:hypothetical protein
MIEKSTPKKPDEIKLKREINCHILNCDFLDTSIAIDYRIEQSPEQSPLPFVASPQPRSSDDDAMDDLEPSNLRVPLPSTNADDVRCKLKEAWEKTYPSETFPDEHIPVSNDDTSGRYTLVKTNLKIVD